MELSRNDSSREKFRWSVIRGQISFLQILAFLTPLRVGRFGTRGDIFGTLDRHLGFFGLFYTNFGAWRRRTRFRTRTRATRWRGWARRRLRAFRAWWTWWTDLRRGRWRTRKRLGARDRFWAGWARWRRWTTWWRTGWWTRARLTGWWRWTFPLRWTFELRYLWTLGRFWCRRRRTRRRALGQPGQFRQLWRWRWSRNLGTFRKSG